MHLSLKSIVIKVISIVSLIYTRSFNSWIKTKKDQLRTWWLYPTFCSIGDSCRFGKIGALENPSLIQIGNNVIFNDFFYLTVFKEWRGKTIQKESGESIIKIGSHCNFGAFNHITAIKGISIGDGCLTGKWVTITDNAHGETDIKSLSGIPALRSLHSKGAVVIGNNVWIGDKVTILPNVVIGDGVIVAANAVVTKDIPSYCIAAGVPAKIINQK